MGWGFAGAGLGLRPGEKGDTRSPWRWKWGVSWLVVGQSACPGDKLARNLIHTHTKPRRNLNRVSGLYQCQDPGCDIDRGL